MTKYVRRTTINLTEATERQVEFLRGRGFGTFTNVVRTAIDRMYRQETELMDRLPKIAVGGSEIECENLDIRTARGTISIGHKLSVSLQYNGIETIVHACNLCETAEQSRSWCINQCEQLAEKLEQHDSYTPGYLMRLLKCGFRPFADLGIPIPPQRKIATKKEGLEFRERTGKAIVYIENDLYKEWVITYNTWIREHPDLAMDYGCVLQDENWIPVK